MKRRMNGSPGTARARVSKLLLAAGASLVLALPAMAADDQGGHGPQGDQSGSHGQGSHGQGSHGQGSHGHGQGGQGQGQGGQGGQGSQGQGGQGQGQGGYGQGSHGQGQGGQGGYGQGGQGSHGQGGQGQGGQGGYGQGGHDRGDRGDRDGFRNDRGSQRRYHHGGYRQPRGWYQHQWRHGEYLPTIFWSRGYWLLDFWLYGLAPPPYNCVWVRYGNDAVLIDRRTGEVIEVIYGVFY